MPSIHVIKSAAAASAMPKDKLSQPKETFSVFNDGDSDDLLEDLKKEKKKQADATKRADEAKRNTGADSADSSPQKRRDR